MRPLTRDVLERLIATCGPPARRQPRRRPPAPRLRFRRPPALGDRGPTGRRSGGAAARAGRPRRAAQGPKLPVLALKLGRAKTASREDDESLLAVGRPVEALKARLEAGEISSGPVFRPIDRWGAVGDFALDGQSVNAIVKRRPALAGLDPAEFSGHGLRSGYLTEAGRLGGPLPEAMRESRHRSVQQAAAYYNEVEIERGRSVRLV